MYMIPYPVRASRIGGTSDSPGGCSIILCSSPFPSSFSSALNSVSFTITIGFEGLEGKLVLANNCSHFVDLNLCLYEMIVCGHD